MMPAFTDHYDILFRGLKTGVHHFSYELGDSFFEHFENPDCPGGEVHVAVEMGKKERLLTFSFRFSGVTEVTCDRCLDKFSMPVEFECSLFVKFGEEPEESDADVIYLDENEHKLNIAGYMLESIRLSLPLKKVHPDDEEGNAMCDRNMMEKLDRHRPDENKGNTDPRWDALKNIVIKKN